MGLILEWGSVDNHILELLVFDILRDDFFGRNLHINIS